MAAHWDMKDQGNSRKRKFLPKWNSSEFFHAFELGAHVFGARSPVVINTPVRHCTYIADGAWCKGKGHDLETLASPMDKPREFCYQTCSCYLWLKCATGKPRRARNRNVPCCNDADPVLQICFSTFCFCIAYKT